MFSSSEVYHIQFFLEMLGVLRYVIDHQSHIHNLIVILVNLSKIPENRHNFIFFS